MASDRWSGQAYDKHLCSLNVVPPRKPVAKYYPAFARQKERVPLSGSCLGGKEGFGRLSKEGGTTMPSIRRGLLSEPADCTFANKHNELSRVLPIDIVTSRVWVQNPQCSHDIA